MAEVATASVNPNEPVPLDSIPISPETSTSEGRDLTSNGPVNGDATITVFHDSSNFNVKHPLMNKWTLWFTKPPSGKGDNWNELLKEVISFDSVEEFWGIYNNITPASQLAQKSDYHLFKYSVRPEWEDLQNKHGGKWAYSFRDRKAVDIDNVWLHVMLAAIGETLEDEDDGEVMGVVVNVRKGFYRIGLWTKSTGKPFPGGGEGNAAGGKGRSQEVGKEILMKIGKRFKECLGLKEGELVEFTGHTDAARSGSTRATPKLTI